MTSLQRSSGFAPEYKGIMPAVWDMGLVGDDMLRSLETAHEEAQRRIKARFSQSVLARQGFKKPRFGTNAYREYMRKGYITPEEAEADAIMREIRAERAGRHTASCFQGGEGAESTVSSLQAVGRAQVRPVRTRVSPVRLVRTRVSPVRWGRQAPIPSDQYAPNMATTAARDERLTPNAKALLQIIHARCGREGVTETTKGTLANIMNRSTRSIQRYIADLVLFGYLIADIKRNARGLYVGLVLRVGQATKPFYADLKRTGEVISQYFNLGASETDISFVNLDKTLLSSKKQTLHKYNKDSLMADPFD